MDKKLKILRVSCKELIGWLFIAISLIMIVNSIRLCLSSDIWYDELFTMGMVEHSYGELISFTARDVHPPLYYIIAKLILDLCKLAIPSADSVIIVKIVSVMPYLFLLIYAITFLRKRFGIFVSGVFCFCILAMPQMSAYTVEMRMYSWAMFFVTATFFHAYEIVVWSVTVKDVDSRKGNVKHWSVGNYSIWIHGIRNYNIQNYVALTLYGLAAAYTQYFACVAVVMVYLYLLIWFVFRYRKYHDQTAVKALKGWIASFVFSILAYLPWLFILISQITAVRSNYWILPLTWRSIGGCVKFLMKPAFWYEWINVAIAVIMFLVYVVLPVIYGFTIWKNKVNNINKADGTDGILNENSVATFFYAVAGCLVLCGLVAFGFIASIIIRPIFVYRYMLPALGCFWLCFALCLDKVSEKSEYIIINGITYFTVILVFIVGYTNYRAFMGEEEYRTVLMQETEQAFSDIAKTNIILYNFDQLQAVCGYYINHESYLWNAVPEQLIVDMFGNKGSIQDADSIKEWLDEGRTVWFFGSFNSREDIIAEWAQDGIDTEEIGSYMLERYWFNIYRLYYQN